MPALAGTALLNKLLESSAEKVRFIPKNGGDPIKAKIVEIFVGKKKKDGKEGARVIPLEGDYEDGKVYFIPSDRLKGMQGRQPGFSPTKKESPETESPAPAAKKGAAKTEKKAETKVKKAPANDEAFDLTSALEEVKDLTEAAQDIAERLAAISAFMENLEMGDGEANEEAEEEAEEESPAPAPKKGSSKAKAGKGSSKPRHDDEDEA